MTQNNTVELNIATANTSKATKDIKSLKEQIRDLKNEMAGLSQGTDEYNQAAAQLGDLMHQQAEITEVAKLATNDYGQTLSNITSISAGAVGSLSALNGVMNLIGASSDESLEAIRKMQSLMSIITGLNQLDAAEKAFKGLMTRIKLLSAARKDDTQATITNSQAQAANTTAGTANAVSMKAQTVAAKGLKVGLVSLGKGFRTLGAAMKAFMLSNPFTMIILAVTTIISLVSNLTSKFREAKEEAERIRLENLTKDLDELNKINLDDKFKKGIAQRIIGADPQLYTKTLEELENKATEVMSRLTVGANSLKKQTEEAAIQHGKNSAEYIAALNAELEAEKEYYEYMAVANQKKKEMYDAEIKSEEELKKLRGENYSSAVRMNEEAARKSKEAEEAADSYLLKLYDINQSLTDNALAEKERVKNEEKKAQEERDRQAAAAKKAADDRRARELAAIKTAYERQKLLTNSLYRDQELTTEEYYDRQLKELKDYLAKWTELRKKHNKQTGVKGILDENKKATWLTEEDLLEIEKMNDQEVELERKKTEAIIELRKRQADSLNYRPDSSRSSVDDGRYQNAQNAMTDETGARYLEQQEELYNAWWVKKYMLLQEFNQKEIEEERRHNDELNQLAMEKYAEQERVLNENRDGDNAYEEQRFQNEMDYLNQRLEAKLISQQEYNLAVEELEREHQERLWEIENEYNDSWLEIQTQRTETLRDISQQRYEIELEEIERRKEAISSYVTAYQSVNSAISGIMAQAQQMYKEGSKQYEQIQEASIIMDTISGSLAAFMSGVKSGLPAPYNFIFGGVLSAAAIAEGAMALNNLHSKKLSSGASNAPSVSAYQTVAYETGAELSGDIQDQRVYVTETDISDTLNRVNVMETESTF